MKKQISIGSRAVQKVNRDLLPQTNTEIFCKLKIGQNKRMVSSSCFVINPPSTLQDQLHPPDGPLPHAHPDQGADGSFHQGLPKHHQPRVAAHVLHP